MSWRASGRPTKASQSETAQTNPERPKPTRTGPVRTHHSPHRSRMRHTPVDFLGFLSLMSMRKLRDWAVIMKPAS